MEFVPKGNMGLLDLIQRLVQARFGPDAVAPMEVLEDDEGEIHLSRNGGEIAYTEDIKRWEAARKSILSAMISGELTASTEKETGGEYTVPISYWQGGGAWRPLITGKLEAPRDGGFDNRPIYIDEAKAKKWINETVVKVKSIPQKRRGGPRPGPYLGQLGKFLKHWNENIDGGLGEAKLVELREGAKQWFKNHNVKGYPLSKTGLNDPIQKIMAQILMEARNH
jgi:hypothetical protein